MKSPASEVAAVSEIVTRLSLAHPQVGFRLINNGKTTIDLPVHSATAERVAALFGRDVASRLTSICYDRAEGVHLEGFCARPPESRSNSRGIYVFLNRRWIRHAGIVRVIRDAYQGALPPRRYPFAVIFLEVDPQLVDVNVHPTKEEVRFENDRLIVGGVRRAVEEALQNAVRQVREARSLPGTERFLDGDAEKHDVPIEVAEDQGETTRSEAPAPVRPAPLRMVPVEAAASDTPAEQASGPEREGPQQQTLATPPKHHVLAQAGNRYLVVESPEGIVLVDQHALHERWNFERLKEKKRAGVSQKLLLPVVVELAPEEAALFDQALPVLQEVGFEAERFGVSTLSVSAVPDIVKTNKVEQVIRDVFADLQRGDGRSVFEDIREHILARLACRSAVLFGKHLPHEALVTILDKFYEADQPLTCPHGRPTTITLSWEELERRFGRSG